MRLPLDRGSLYHEHLGAGTPMLLMHGGLGLDHTTLRPWLDPLADALELVYYDHLANGRSDFPGDPDELTHELWVETADELRAHLGHDRILLFGHSYGAFLALEYALRHGDRLLGLVLSDVAPALDYPEAMMTNARRQSDSDETLQAVTEALSGPVASDEDFARMFRRIHRIYFKNYDPEEHDRVLEDVVFRADALNRSTFACLPEYDVTGRLGEIGVPTLVLSGVADWITPPEQGGSRVADGIPGAEHVIFDESGHWPFVEENERFLAVVREWLASRA